jgi:dTDP-glucose 4,6-dehydratase/UDP-glucuronate decarboxylase
MGRKEDQKTCLVAGGAGFIGSHLCESLIKDGYKVICIDNFLTGSKQNVANLMDSEQFVMINTDIVKPLPQVMDDFEVDFVFHLASPASPNPLSPLSYLNHPLETMDVNSLGTRRLLRLSRKKGAKFLFASTSEVYGTPSQHPQKEGYWGYVNPNGLRSCYDESKRFGESLTMVYVRRFKLDARIIRIFNTYGSRMDLLDGRAIVNLSLQALKNEPLTVYGKGDQTRSFCYVSDMVVGIKKAMFSAKTLGEVINLGSPEELTIMDLAKKIKRATKSNAKIIHEQLPEDDPDRRKPDIAKAKKLLSWEPKITFNQGLPKLLAYFSDQLEKDA